MKAKKILITGVAGFMGGHLSDYLVEKGEDVYGVDDLSGGYASNVNANCKFTNLDLRNKDAVRVYMEALKPDLIYHLAADATEGRSQFTPLNCTERTYMGYLNLLTAAINNGLKKIVVASSMSVYGAQQAPFNEEMDTKPEDIYAISKASKERATQILSKVNGFDYTIVRPHNVYGEKQNMSDPYRNVVAIFINRILGEKPFYIYGEGDQKRSFTYIDDFVPAFAKCGFSDKTNGEIINIGPGEDTAITIKELGDIVLKSFFGDDIPEKYKPMNVPDRPQEVKDAFCTYDKANKLLGYEPKISIEDGIVKMIDWAKKLGYQEPKYLDKIEIVSENIPKTWKDKLI